MKENSIFKMFVKYVSLNVIAMIGLSCYILADTFFVANGIGIDGLAGLNLAIPVYSIINGVGLMIGMGGGTKYAIYKAQERDDKANQVFSHAVVMGAVLGVIFLLGGIFFSEKLSWMLGADTVTFDMTNDYLKTIMCFGPMFVMNNVLIGFIRNDGAPNLTMMAMLAGSASNIVLDYVAIFLLGWGMFGAAAATGCAPIISMVLMSSYFLKKKNNFRLVRCPVKISGMFTIVKLGIASLITEVSSGVVIIIFNMVILTLEGNLGVAAYGIIANLALVATSIFTGIAQGIQPLISSSYGAGRIEDIRKVKRMSIITALCFAVLLYTTVLVIPEAIIAVFNSEGDAVLEMLAKEGLRSYFAGFFFAGLNIVFASLFSSMEKPGYSFIVSMMRGCVLIVPFLLILSYVWGMTGVWASYVAAEAVTLLLVFIFNRRSEKNLPNKTVVWKSKENAA